MRIVSGSARGRKLFAPVGMDIRPTTDKVKEAMFSIVQFDVGDAVVLDLFAGSPQPLHHFSLMISRLLTMCFPFP